MIVPDVLAVVDCDPDIEPDSWVVQDQKRGIDLVIEVRNLGRKQKDLVENVRATRASPSPSTSASTVARGICGAGVS
jgi:hypothetical protein